jgi:hypothetical protein
MRAGRLQLIHNNHSGYLRPHSHTSYAGLAFVILLCAVLLLGVSWTSMAAPPAVNPQSGSVGLAGVVRGPAPDTAAVITSPRNGQHTSSIPITVSGVCSKGTFVTITKNEVFAGAVACSDNGSFSLQIDLFDGLNRLVAKVSDALGQSGPDSAAIEVTYDAPSFNVPGGGAIGKQLFLQASTSIVGVSPGVAARHSATIVGGVGPYAISWDWGDGQTSLASQAIEGSISASHVYERPGNYRVIVRVTDSAGNAAFLQLVTVVNGPADPIGANKGTGAGALPGSLLTAWPLLGLAGLMVLVFWLGERRQNSKLRRQAARVVEV